MISPFGSEILQSVYIDDSSLREDLLKEAQSLPSIVISSSAAANAVMLGGGYFNPLKGFMNLQETLKVSESMQLDSGVFWPVPILNMLHDQDLNEGIRSAPKIALRDPNIEGNPVLAVQEVNAIEFISNEAIKSIINQVFGTEDPKHPGVVAFSNGGNTLISGPIQVLNFSYFSSDFPETFRTATQIRTEIETRGWEKTAAFQTRNPMHRAHEELCKMAMKDLNADGLLIHMLLGKLKKGDIPADVRETAIQKMVENYFPENRVMITGYGFDMLYAGPREALLHAVFRQNAGCTHLIVGRDHAGVGDFYGAFDAQDIFDSIPEDSMQIKIFRGDHTVWCHQCEKVVMMRDCPHGPDDYLLLSGTRVREMLSQGKELPPEFARPEVTKILSAYYQTIPQ
jgi:sulfate adenylyltransferase